jgi:hypothetical protein
MSSILDFRGLYFCAKRISTMYVRGYLQGSENGRLVTIAFGDVLNILQERHIHTLIFFFFFKSKFQDLKNKFQETKKIYSYLGHSLTTVTIVMVKTVSH